MNAKSKSGRAYTRAFYTFGVAVLLLVVFFAMNRYTYTDAEKEGLDELRLQLTQINEDISLQIISDQENLLTMARLAATLHSDSEDTHGYDVLLQSFQSIGLIDHIAILTPDNVLHTRVGNLDVSSQLSFEELERRGQHISGRISDITNPDLQIVRCSVPIVSEDETVAILFGAITIERLSARYNGYIDASNSEFFLVERSSGNFIIDSLHDTSVSLDDLQGRKARKGFSYEQMLIDVREGKSGFTAFKSGVDGEYLYMYYAPMEIDNWQIMLIKTEDVLFAEAHTVGNMMTLIFIAVIVIMALYVVIVFNADRRQSAIFQNSSRTRKLLLEINQRSDSINAALESVSRFAHSRSAFYVDSDGEDFFYIQPSLRKEILSSNERHQFVDYLLELASKQRKPGNIESTVMYVALNSKLYDVHAELYDFMKAHHISGIAFASVENKKEDNVILLGIINPRRRSEAKAFLREIFVCFSMAIYNKKYLNRMEAIAVTDSLTGLSNRLAYKRMIAIFDERMPEQFSCIYVDVNELHIINNKYGHAAGDEMLLFVAYALQKVFPRGYTYRVGGDEFLVFNEGLPREDVVQAIATLEEMCSAQKYHISVGMDFRIKNIDTESVVKEAEKRMYEAKAEFYQQRKQDTGLNVNNLSTEHSYIGIYCVSFKTDTAYSILMSGYFKRFVDHTDSFSKALFSYMHELVQPDYHRAMLSSLKYDVLKKQLYEGHTPSIAFTKTTGERIVVSVYAVPEQDDIEETIWTFERV